MKGEEIFSSSLCISFHNVLLSKLLCFSSAACCTKNRLEVISRQDIYSVTGPVRGTKESGVSLSCEIIMKCAYGKCHI